MHAVVIFRIKVKCTLLESAHSRQVPNISRRKPWNSILETRDSILESFESRESSLESPGSRREWLLTYFWAVQGVKETKQKGNESEDVT